MGLKSFIQSKSLRAKNDKRTNAAGLTLRESLFPLILVTSLFFLWGFSYGLLDTLNKHFQNVLDIDRARSAGLQAAYFGAYPLASLGHAAWILRHYSYKATFIWGLFLYGLGSLIAIPCIKAKSFGGFCAAIFIIGNGLGSLETAANPYITVCGPPRYAEIRINLSQAFNGIGSVVAPLMGSYVFFKFDDNSALDNVQWVYVAIAVFVWALAVVFWLSHIPEITDADMEFQASQVQASYDDKPFWKQYTLFHAAFAQFCYAGAQVAIASMFINYVVETRPGTSDSLAAQFFAGAQGAFAVGRFVGVGLMHFIRPRMVFLGFLFACAVFIAPAIHVTGNIGMSLLFVVLFFESICFPTIVALGMRGLGRHSKRGSGWIIAGVIGGACVPPLTGATGDRHGMGIAMTIPLTFFVLALTYAASVNFVPQYRDVVDAFTVAEVGVVDLNVDEEKTAGTVEMTVSPETKRGRPPAKPRASPRDTEIAAGESLMSYAESSDHPEDDARDDENSNGYDSHGQRHSPVSSSGPTPCSQAAVEPTTSPFSCGTATLGPTYGAAPQDSMSLGMLSTPRFNLETTISRETNVNNVTCSDNPLEGSGDGRLHQDQFASIQMATPSCGSLQNSNTNVEVPCASNPVTDAASDCRHAFLRPLLAHIDGLVPIKLACDLFDIFLTDQGSLLFRGACPFILTRIFRKASITHPTNPRAATPALIATILWCVAQTADLLVLHVPGSRRKTVSRLYRLVISLISRRDPDRRRYIDASRMEPATVGLNENPEIIDDLLTYILLAVAVSGSEFRSHTQEWWTEASRLVFALRLHRDDERCPEVERPCLNPVCCCQTNRSVSSFTNMERREERRRIFWLYYCLDRHLALSFNACLSIPDSLCEVYAPLPEDIWENLDSVSQESFPVRTTSPPTTVSGITFFEHFLPLMVILGDIIEVQHRRRHPRLGGDDSTGLQSNNDPFSSRLQPENHSKVELVHAYCTHILHVLHVLLYGKWDAISMMEDRDDWITSAGFSECASHAIAASQTLPTILQIDPELTFMPYLFGIYLLHGSFIFLLFADRMPHVGPNQSVEQACENIIRAHEVSIVTLTTEFQVGHFST
ncbi:hypothetical protein FDECE_10148 [Fusarium decemcellulare]|nr:hypothetical protein FDECE_10148 [Fusarium decemcellulare]